VVRIQYKEKATTQEAEAWRNDYEKLFKTFRTMFPKVGHLSRLKLETMLLMPLPPFSGRQP